MTPQQLIKARIAHLKEKELREGLEDKEHLELGKLYITDEFNDTYQKEVDKSEVSYWKTRCQLAEASLRECDIEENHQDSRVFLKHEAFINDSKLKY